MAAEEDALKTIKELRELSTLIKHIQSELTLIEETLRQLEKGEEIKSESLKMLGLTHQSSTVLKLRLKGMLSKRKVDLSEYRLEERNRRELLYELIKCPECGGRGSKSTTSYDRNDGKVTPTLKVEQCLTCGGSGKAAISSRILEMIKDNIN